MLKEQSMYNCNTREISSLAKLLCHATIGHSLVYWN